MGSLFKSKRKSQPQVLQPLTGYGGGDPFASVMGGYGQSYAMPGYNPFALAAGAYSPYGGVGQYGSPLGSYGGFGGYGGDSGYGPFGAGGGMINPYGGGQGGFGTSFGGVPQGGAYGQPDVNTMLGQWLGQQYYGGGAFNPFDPSGMGGAAAWGMGGGGRGRRRRGQQQPDMAPTPPPEPQVDIDALMARRGLRGIDGFPDELAAPTPTPPPGGYLPLPPVGGWPPGQSPTTGAAPVQQPPPVGVAPPQAFPPTEQVQPTPVNMPIVGGGFPTIATPDLSQYQQNIQPQQPAFMPGPQPQFQQMQQLDMGEGGGGMMPEDFDIRRYRD